MSIDQQYPDSGGYGGRGAMGFQHEQMHERRAPLHERYRPFLGPYVLTMIVLPLLELAGWGVRSRISLGLGLEIVFCWMALGFITATVATCIGLFVSKRITFVVAHITVVSFALAMIAAFTTLRGWPGWWIVLHFFLSGTIATTIMLYRADSLRSLAGQNVRDGWGNVIGLIRSTPRTKISEDGTHAEIEVNLGPGETMDKARSGAKIIESAINAVEGRTVVTNKDGRAGGAKMTFTLTDPFANGSWLRFPGPSHPGMSFAYPLRTGYYEDSHPKRPETHEWFSLASTGELRSPLVPGFSSELDTFMGAVGITGSGKSGFLNNLAAEILTRNDAILCWIDKEKILQNAGWCLDMLGMAGNQDSAVPLIKALRELARYRVGLFGQVALDAVFDPAAGDANLGRKWTPELYVETGEAAVVAIVDEADTAIHGTTWDWLAARGRSLGIFIVVATTRASAAEVPAFVRGNIGAWKTFGIGDNYSDGFTMSAETQDAGADPKKFREAGLHYLDRAPGVDKARYPVVAREFKSSTVELRNYVLAARQTFEPARFSEAAKTAMGEPYRRCDPQRLLAAARGQVERTEPVTPVMPPQDTAGDGPLRNYVAMVASGEIQASDEERDEARRIMAANAAAYRPDDEADEPDAEEADEQMTPTAQGVDLEQDEAAPLDLGSLGYDADDVNELRRIDPRTEPWPQAADDGISLADDGKPVWSPEDTERELDRVLIEFHRTGRGEFGNQDVMEAMRCHFAPYTVSRRLDAVSAAPPTRIPPEGLSVRRHGKGRFSVVGPEEV